MASDSPRVPEAAQPEKVLVGAPDKERPDARAWQEPWVLVERYVEHYPTDWRLLFKRGWMTLDVSVPEETWRAFDGIKTWMGETT